MSVLESVFSRLRAKKAEQQVSAYRAYRAAVLVPLANDQEVDFEVIEKHLGALGIGEEELENEVKTLRNRITAHSQRQRGLDAEVQLAGIMGEIEATNAAAARARDEFNAKLAALHERRRNIESLTMQVRPAEIILRSTVQDQELIQAIADQKKLLGEISQRIDYLRTQLERNVYEGVHTIRYRCNVIEDEIAAITAKIGDKNTIGDALLDYATGNTANRDGKRRLAELRADLERLEPQRKAIETELEQKRAEYRAAERRLAELDREIMVP